LGPKSLEGIKLGYCVLFIYAFVDNLRQLSLFSIWMTLLGSLLNGAEAMNRYNLFLPKIFIKSLRR
jgi:hypothetical protein